MRFDSWYTDTMDIIRVEHYKDGNLDKERRIQAGSAVPCRVYSTNLRGAVPTATAAADRGEDKLACKIGTDIKSGDELLVTRGAKVGGSEAERYIAGRIQRYYDPVGRKATGLDHIEVGLLADNLGGY